MVYELMVSTVMTRCRTALVEDKLTVRQAQEELESRGMKLSLNRTFQYYGLQYFDDKAFTSKYRDDFNLSDKKTLYDIKIHELVVFKSLLVGHSTVGYQMRERGR